MRCIEGETRTMASRRPVSGIPIWLIVLVPIVLLGGTVLAAKFLPKRGEIKPSPSPSLSISPSPSISPDSTCLELQKKQEEARFSSGERILFSQDTKNIDLENGVNEFKLGNFGQKELKSNSDILQIPIMNYFVQAMKATPNHPEPKIYYNNAKARTYGCPYRIIAVVPIDNRRDVAKEILRGVADAQDEFNQIQESQGGRLLEVVIANDGNDAQGATRQVAKEILVDPAILGVIGHNSSEASESALEIYQGDETQKIAMISPTSTSTDLKGEAFFRTVPDNDKIAQVMTDYLKDKVNSQKIVIFYEEGSDYSKTLGQALKDQLAAKSIPDEIDISPPDLDIEGKITDLIAQGVDTVILLPSTATTLKMGPIIKTIREKEDQNSTKIQILGGDTLYNPDVLTQGDNTLENLVVVAPVISEDYQVEASKTWLGQVSWRTVASYNATELMIEAIKEKEPTRESILENLTDIFNKPDVLKNSEPILMITDPNAPKPPGAKFGFKRLE